MEYMANVNGQEIPLGISIDSLQPGYLKIGWYVEGYGQGSWIMNKKSLQSATGGLGENPQPGVDEVVPDDKAQFVLSKDQWTALMKDKKVKHNGVEYNLAAPAAGSEFKLGDKIVDAVYLQTSDKAGQIWVLNNPETPLLLKVVGNANGPDLTALSIQ